MLVACTACHARFDAASYRDVLCPTCGAVAQPRPCPRCLLPLQPRHIHDLVLDECSQCHGLFLDAAAKQLLAEQDAARAEALFDAVSTSTHEASADVETNNIASCPVCGVAMHRKLSETGAGIVIDICKPHGTFYDGGELQQLLAHARRQAIEIEKLDAEQREYAKRLRQLDGSIGQTAKQGLTGAVVVASVVNPIIGIAAQMFVGTLIGAVKEWRER